MLSQTHAWRPKLLYLQQTTLDHCRAVQFGSGGEPQRQIFIEGELPEIDRQFRSRLLVGLFFENEPDVQQVPQTAVDSLCSKWLGDKVVASSLQIQVSFVLERGGGH